MCEEVLSNSCGERKITSLHRMTGCKEGKVVIRRERWRQLYWKSCTFSIFDFSKGAECILSVSQPVMYPFAKHHP